MDIVPPSSSAAESHDPVDKIVSQGLKADSVQGQRTKLEVISSWVAIQRGGNPCANISQCREYDNTPPIPACPFQPSEESPEQS